MLGKVLELVLGILPFLSRLFPPKEQKVKEAILDFLTEEERKRVEREKLLEDINNGK